MRKRLFGLLLVLVAFTGAAWAEEVTVSDPGSSFDLIYDTNNLGLFGVPTLVNNTVFFTPTTFFALSNDGIPPLGDGVSTTNSTVVFRLVAKNPSTLLQNFLVQANGDYRLDGLGTEVDVDGQIRLFDPEDPFNQFTDQLTTSSDLTINDGNTHDWEATAALGFSGSNEVVITLQNILTASSTLLGSSAFIEKKFEGVQITVVPIPAAAWLFGSGLLGLGLMRRRRNAVSAPPAQA
jgi:hypothetical protein